jgi:hypothetical protein
MSNTTNYNLGKFEPTGDVYVDAVSTLGNNMDIIDGVMHESRVDLDIIRTAKTTTGTATAIAVDTDGTFDLTRNGNILTIIPNTTNTGTMTINVDGQGAIGIRKANDAGTLVVLEAGDIKQNVPTQLVRDTVNNFFVYAPRGGSSIKSIQRGTTSFLSSSTTIDVPITPIKKVTSIAMINFIFANDAQDDCVSIKILDDSTLRLQRVGTGTLIEVNWQVIEYVSLKSRQEGALSSVFTNVTISTVNTAKSFIYASFRSNMASTSGAYYALGYKINSPTQISLLASTAASAYTQYVAEWQVIEFN